MQDVTLILGGSRSGKSSFGEKIALSKNARPIYIFTAQPLDEEMHQRIQIHKERRKNRDWQDVEAPLELCESIMNWDKRESTILVDCLSMWITNLMMTTRDVDVEIRNLLSTVKACSGELIFVSNEVGFGIIPENAMAREFRDHLGLLHQKLAATAKNVVMMIAGIPVIIKGKNEISENTKGFEK